MKKTAKKSTAGGVYKIECNFAEEVLVPHEAIDRAFFERALPWTDDVFVTLDGKRCKPEFVSSWSDINESMMNEFCKSHWDMPFPLVRSLWYDRLGLRYGLRCWHYIKLHELG